MGNVPNPLDGRLLTGSSKVDQVLAGRASYDSLRESEQAVVRAAWAERIAARRNALNFEAEFVAAGESWSEADEDGNVIIRATGR